MSVLWSGVTEEGAVVPVQVTAEGKVVVVGDGPEGEFLRLTGGNLTGDLTLGTDIGGTLLPASPSISLNADGSGTFAGTVVTADGVGGQVALFNDCKIRSYTLADDGSSYFIQGSSGNPSEVKFEAKNDGSASFKGDVVIGSRGEQWLINGASA